MVLLEPSPHLRSNRRGVSDQYNVNRVQISLPGDFRGLFEIFKIAGKGHESPVFVLFFVLRTNCNVKSINQTCQIFKTRSARQDLQDKIFKTRSSSCKARSHRHVEEPDPTKCFVSS